MITHTKVLRRLFLYRLPRKVLVVFLVVNRGYPNVEMTTVQKGIRLRKFVNHLDVKVIYKRPISIFQRIDFPQ